MHLRLTTGLLLSRFAYFANADCGRTSTTSTVSNAADASALSSCTVFSGSLAIATDAAGDIAIPGVQEILGNLVAENIVNVTSIGASQLRRLDGTFLVDNVQDVGTLNFPALTDVGNITFLGLANLASFYFKAGINSVSVVNIQNTFLTSLEGLNIINADTVTVVNNRFLQSLDFPLKSVTNSLTVESNGDRCALSLSDLTTAGTIYVRDVPELALPVLNFVTGNLSFMSTYITNLSLQNLQVVNGDLVLDANPVLLSVSLPALLSVGDTVQVIGNITSMHLDQMSAVGSIDITSPLQNLSLPSLRSLNGSFSVNASGSSFDCSAFDQYQADHIIPGPYTCIGERGTVTGTAPTGTHSTGHSTTGAVLGASSGAADASPSAKADPLSGGAIGGIVVGALFGLAALALGGYLLRRRKKGRGQPNDVGSNGRVAGNSTPAEKDGRQVFSLNELSTGVESHEAEEYHGLSEAEGQQRFELPDHRDQI